MTTEEFDNNVRTLAAMLADVPTEYRRHAIDRATTIVGVVDDIQKTFIEFRDRSEIPQQPPPTDQTTEQQLTEFMRMIETARRIFEQAFEAERFPALGSVNAVMRLDRAAALEARIHLAATSRFVSAKLAGEE